MIFPWQQTQWQQLYAAKKNNRLPHGLLFAGMSGIGKAHFADAFTRMLLCQQPQSDGSGCMACHACRLLEGRAHPNVLWVEPEKEGQAIKVDQIRELNEFVAQSSIQGDYRVVIINPANNMNVNAANALLKTLEEPSSGAVLVLVSDQNGKLPATILSRCQRITFGRPDAEQALRWLQLQDLDTQVAPSLLLALAHGAPLAAKKLISDGVLETREMIFQAMHALAQNKQNPLQFATKLKDTDSLLAIDFVWSWMLDLLRLQAGEQAIINTDYTDKLQHIAEKTANNQNALFMVYLQKLRREIMQGINLNKQLLIENIFIRYLECV